ncbi:SusC/RagA family TonB-linked outer membrane protein [Flammeovirga aprica]|uniref:SusC/RagA family TonB-linked outer membrane protein n=1 Tax=Flammeovirga aprica JL-4 TaxID=694437 RepID=A0A7X9RSB0_9BACT|nr:SusC/RagA family TonB-linked outer membrane protein [Flammeovirga aprica]NME67005.1 SusC/RagA family TonB-linked outer membrane protein [Flammeovirga aprica JL-4]
MKFRLLTLVISLLLMTNFLQAQESLVKGTVSENGTGEPLPGVNVLIKGTSVGTTTDFNGEFSLTVGEGSTLSFSYIGYKTQDVEVGTQTSFDISLEVDAEQLEEVVVTAFGMERESKALGYAVQEVKGDDLAVAKEPSVINGLSGKVSGVQITKTAGGAGGSSRVVIRGNNSLTGSNQPLYIVDGVPIDNSSFYNTGSYWDGGVDYGDGIGDINPDDIESLSVLKGPAAAALYGSRAAGGVILITTKKGKNRNGKLTVEYNGNFTFENPLVLPNFQNEYGLGRDGVIPAAEEIRSQQNSQSSWGPRMQGQTYTDWTGNESQYTAQPDNVKDFFNTGTTMMNSIAVGGGDEKANFRLSYANLKNEGMVPTSTFERNSVGLRGSMKKGILTVDSKVNYFNVKGYNRAYMAETMENPMFTFINMGRSVRTQDLKNNTMRDGEHFNFSNNQFLMNPYYALEKAPNWDEKNRVLGFVSAKFDIMEGLSFQARTGLDHWTHDRFRTSPKGAEGTVYRPAGRLEKDAFNVTEQNTDFIFNFKKDFSSDLSLSAIAGANFLHQNVVYTNTLAGALVERDWYSFNNADGGTATRENITEKKVHSVFGSANIGYKNVLFLDLTARNDWSSALPNQSFFYPSVTGAFAFSELLDVDESIFTFGKVRASWAKVGKDTDPYSTSLAYSIITQDVINGQPAGAIGTITNRGDITSVSVIDPNLLPEITTSWEIGADLKFLNNRIGLDVTYYSGISENQVIPVPLPNTAGAQSIVVNQGSMKNSGIELMLTANAIQKGSFNWDITANFTKNTNELVSLYEEVGLDELLLNQSARGEVRILAQTGKPYGQIVGRQLVRDASGNPQFNAETGEDGLTVYTPQFEEDKELGNITPDFMLGLSNRFSYKNFVMNVVLDAKIGGDMFSYTNYNLHRNGHHQTTADQRNAGGVNVSVDGSVQKIDTQAYYDAIGNSAVADAFVQDASYVKLREVSFGYKLPTSLTQKVYIQGATISFIGRNLALLYSGVDGIDPESLVSRGMLGIEYAAIPSSASYGFNLNLKF